jgi:hypothetical protein
MALDLHVVGLPQTPYSGSPDFGVGLEVVAYKTLFDICNANPFHRDGHHRCQSLSSSIKYHGEDRKLVRVQAGAL